MRGLSFKQKAVEAGAAENQIVVQGARKFSGGRARQRGAAAEPGFGLALFVCGT